MILQVGLLLVVMTISSLYSLGYMKSRIKCVSIITVLLSFFSGLRSWWFGDLIKYYTNYLSCTGSDWKNAVFGKWSNIGLRLFFRAAGWLGISYDICIFLIAVFVAVTLGKLIYHYSVSIYWSYLMYIGMGFYVFTYSGLKQSIAMGFICLAMIAILDDNPVRFYCFTALAIIFHTPAVIFLPAYVITKKEFDAVYIWIIAISIVLLFIYRTQIVTFLKEAYYEEEILLGSGKIIGGRATMILIIVALGCWLRPVTATDVTYKKLFSIMIISFMLQSFSVFGNVYTRLADYYFQFVVLYIPYILERVEHQKLMNPAREFRIYSANRNIYMYLSFAITMFSVFYYIRYINGYSYVLTAFKFFWQINAYGLYSG